MKSEHRHELKTNELERIASELGHTAEHYVQENWMLLAAAVVVIALGAGGLVYWKSASGVAGQQGWREFASANKASDFGNVADKFSGTAAGSWARLMEGEIELTSGIRSSFTDRAASRSDLKKAQENFEKLIADKATPSDVMERALFGLARAKEALPDKNLGPSKVDDAAIETYQRLLTEFPISIYKDFAESRIAALKTGTAQDFYAWFEQQNPKPADREIPKDLIPPLPDETKTATGTPVKTVPPSATKSGAPAKPEPPKTGTKPAPSATSPAKPSAASSSSQTPAADEGPAFPAPSSPPAK
ncbi:MAG TPA: hypothetical protein VG055_06810 [Planctomycetaceae bacterium]|jgi:hypothetical protein|nr:hypothetical protein [Planctomycetaceae bacterium]